MKIHIPRNNRTRVVVLGGGFAGINLIKGIINQDIQVVLIDRHNYHTFQPLLYQVATGALEPDSIAYPFRRIFERKENFYFRIAEVTNIHPAGSYIKTSIGDLEYDHLVIATGSKSNFFNLGSDSQYFMPLKTVPQALDLRSLILQNFEKALLTENITEKDGLMNTVIVGAGPTGVELAGALGEMKKYVFPKDYPELDLSRMHIHLFEMDSRVLPSMSDNASQKAEKYLKDLEVNIHLNTAVDGYNGKNVTFKSDSIPADTFIWTAGVQGNHPEGLNAENIDKKNRVIVDSYNRVKGHKNIFAIGDIAMLGTEEDPEGHPMVATVAIQQGKHLAKNIKRILKGEKLRPFQYKEKGYMATIGRNKAVADLPSMKFHGFIAWFLWIVVHILQLVGFRNKLIVVTGWVWNYFTYDRALRLIIRPYKKH